MPASKSQTLKQNQLRKNILLSPEDQYLLERYLWTVSYDKQWDVSYACTHISGKLCRLHRIVMGAVQGQIVDHINGNGLDNRRENLRFASARENALNSRPRSGASKYKGVYRDTRVGTWYVQVRVGGKGKYIGSFATELEAALAYNKAAIEYYGEFARLNEC